jgi:anti-sigma factor RsiW
VQHADEGILHAFLDGELSPAEVTELERHTSVCVPCRTALAEAREFHAESKSMILALDVDVPATRVATRPIPLPRTGWTRRMTTLAWAASLIAAVGLGYSMRPQFDTASDAVSAADAGETIASAPIVQENSPVAPAPLPAGTEGRRAAGPIGNTAGGGAPTTALAPTEGAGVRDVAGLAQREAGRAEQVPAEPRATLAAESPAPAAAAPPKPTRAAASASSDERLFYVDGVPVDSPNRRNDFGNFTVTPPRRITLEEAVGHLGGSIQLIDGLSPQRVELLSGSEVAGADPARPVVRVYYEEPDLGMVTLDQQRPGPSFSSQRAEELAAGAVQPEPLTTAQSRLRRSVSPILPGPEVTTVAWRVEGTWLMLSSRLDRAKLMGLQARVR